MKDQKNPNPLPDPEQEEPERPPRIALLDWRRTAKTLAKVTGRLWWWDKRHRQSSHRPYTRKLSTAAQRKRARTRARKDRARTRHWPRGRK